MEKGSSLKEKNLLFWRIHCFRSFLLLKREVYIKRTVTSTPRVLIQLIVLAIVFFFYIYIILITQHLPVQLGNKLIWRLRRLFCFGSLVILMWRVVIYGSLR